MHDPASLTLTAVLPLLAARTLSARELVAACLARVEAVEPQVLAFVVCTPERALDAARQADDDRAAGRPVGPLAGVPVALKDLYLTRGVPTTASSRVLAGHDPGIDSAVWRRLRDAGAGLLGKTALQEFAYGTGSHPTRNPWDLTRTPGGSSGGSAAAVAARMVPVAAGSDTGGSLRIPAAACGVCTLRPAHGRVSTAGVLPLAASLDTAGVLARRMLDVALLMRLLAGYDGADPLSLDVAVPDYPRQVPDVRGRRLGVLPLAPGTHEGVAAACQAALQLLVERGAVLVPVTPPAGAARIGAIPGTYGELQGPEALAHHAEWSATRAHLYGGHVRDRLRQAAQVTGAEHTRAQQERRDWTAGWRQRFAEQGLDAVASPTLPQPPEPLAGPLPSLALTKGWSVAGFPALSVPVGLVDGLPTGLQLAGLPEREADLVGLGIAVDEEIRFWEREPQ